MGRAIGALAMEHIAVGLVEDHRLVDPVRVYPEGNSSSSPLQSMPAEQIAEAICTQVEAAARGHAIAAVGVGFPGIIRNGIVEESPNLQQVKGFRLESTLSTLLGRTTTVRVLNDADAFAAGIAATRRAPRDPRSCLDARQWRRLRPVSVGRGCVGGRPHNRQPRCQREVLRLRWPGAP